MEGREDADTNKRIGWFNAGKKNFNPKEYNLKNRKKKERTLMKMPVDL